MKVKGSCFCMIRGDTESLTVTLKDSSFVEDEDVIEMTIRKSIDLTQKVFYKKITEFIDGKAVISINPADTAELNFGNYVYDIQWTDKNGVVRTIVPTSNFIIKSEVTYG